MGMSEPAANSPPATVPDPEDDKKSQKDKWKSFFSITNPDLWIAISVIVIVICLGWYFGNQIFNAIIQGKDYFREELPWSLVVYYLVFIACALVFIPYGPFCIAIGFIFGLGWGFLIQMFAIFVSSAVLFVIGRYLFKDYVRFVVAVGMIPNTILNLLIGEALSEAADPEGTNIYHFIGTGIAIVGIMIAVWYASSIAQEVLEAADSDEPPKESDKLIP
eukprot:642353-Hanusia_phi.AAC.3